MFAVTTFYKFVSLPQEQLEALKQQIFAQLTPFDVRGLIVLASEGVNATIAVDQQHMQQVKRWLEEGTPFGALKFKDSCSETAPFRRLRVDLRPEIVTFHYPSASSEEMEASLLSPEEWHAKVTSPEPPVIVDLRNHYEIELGKFRGAIDPQTDVFTEVPEFLKRANLPKDREILMYCTGGVRCEKAYRFFNDQGYQKVRQLSGGILNYLEKFPNGAFDGECFVFDHRVAVDQELQPSKRYKLCVHCGDPAEDAVKCGNCDATGVVCKSCKAYPERLSCSKNCEYHLGRKLLEQRQL